MPRWDTPRPMSKSARVMAWLDAHPAQAGLPAAAIAAALAAWGVTANDARQARYQRRRGRIPLGPEVDPTEARAAVRAHGGKRKAARALGLRPGTMDRLLREEPRP